MNSGGLPILLEIPDIREASLAEPLGAFCFFRRHNAILASFPPSTEHRRQNGHMVGTYWQSLGAGHRKVYVVHIFWQSLGAGNREKTPK